jgi:hypothetical protein
LARGNSTFKVPLQACRHDERQPGVAAFEMTVDARWRQLFRDDFEVRRRIELLDEPAAEDATVAINHDNRHVFHIRRSRRTRAWSAE